MGFSKKIDEYFKNKGLNNREIGKIMDGYNEQLVGRYRNSDEISKTFIKKIAKYFPDANIDYLIKEDEEDLLSILNEPNAIYSSEPTQLIEEIEDRLHKLKEILAQNCHNK